MLDHLQDRAFALSKAMDQPSANVCPAAEVDGAAFTDATPIICPGKACPAVIGDVLVYRNGSHLTATYVRILTPWPAERLPDSTGS